MIARIAAFKPEQFDVVLKEHTEELKPGDVFFQYTDGIPEAPNTNKKQYGEERLRQMIKRYSRTPMRELLSIIAEDLADHARGMEQEDDITMVGMRVMRKSPATQVFLKGLDAPEADPPAKP